MTRYSATLFVLATLTATALVAQSPEAAVPTPAPPSQPAPIERAPHRNLSAVTTQQPAQGVYVRVGVGAAVTTISKAADRTELRVDRGIVNVSVRHPADNSLIQVDLPGGQVNIVKDGFYTFNAQTNTVHVLLGQARAFPSAAGDKGVKVKEYQQFAFAGAGKPTDLNPMQARSDVLPFPRANGGVSGYAGYRGEPNYGGGYYPATYGYGYPYGYGYGWGYPYGYGYGFGYPFVGVGFGYGFGGFYGGFHGRR